MKTDMPPITPPAVYVDPDIKLVNDIIDFGKDELILRYNKGLCMNCGGERSKGSVMLCGQCFIDTKVVVRRFLMKFTRAMNFQAKEQLKNLSRVL